MCDEKTLREIFKAFDADGSGMIDQKEWTDVMKAYFEAVGEPADEKKCKDTAALIMKEIDTSGDGMISINEFVKAFK